MSMEMYNVLIPLFLKKSIPETHRAAITLIAKTPTEFEAALPSLYLDIALDGLILHDTNHYLEIRLNHLRQLIQKQGLYREQIANDLIWRWQTFPGHDWSISWGMTS